MRFGAQMIATRGQPRALAHLGSQRPSGVVVPDGVLLADNGDYLVADNGDYLTF